MTRRKLLLIAAMTMGSCRTAPLPETETLTLAVTGMV